MTGTTVIHWFRQDLRISDNPAFSRACESGKVLPVFILDDAVAGDYSIGSASRWWLYHSLKSLNSSLNGKLSVYQGDSLEILKDLTARMDVKELYFNRCYEPFRVKGDSEIKDQLVSKGVSVFTENGSLLWEPDSISKSDGTPYKVFTPYYRKGCLQAPQPRIPLPVPGKLLLAEDKQNRTRIDDLRLLPDIRWDKKLENHWNAGENNAQNRLADFLENGIHNYKEGRNYPSREFVSRLSPYLHFGEISPNQVWYAAVSHGDDTNIDHFCSELGWREFSYSQLFYNPEMPYKNLRPKFNDFPWVKDDVALRAWQRGETGIPIVDAGMRELWQTGYIHNRVRMIVGSFLVKNLLLHWQHGERWFWDCLVDADLANNSASWQWVAGCGADAAPYFRIFNPVTQGQKFDPDGKYTKQYIPELGNMPERYLFNPWDAPQDVLAAAGVRLGKDYPEPIVDLKASRERALDSFKSLG